MRPEPLLAWSTSSLRCSFHSFFNKLVFAKGKKKIVLKKKLSDFKMLRLQQYVSLKANKLNYEKHNFSFSSWSITPYG